MPNAHVEIRQTVRQSDNPRDFCVNNIYFSGGQSTTPAWQDLTDRVSAAFSVQASAPTWGPWNGRGFQVKAYDLADIKPRPIKAMTTFTPGIWANGALAPRQLCIVLSYYADRNLPSTRGHIFLGPWELGQTTQERVNSATMNQALDLGKKLYGLAALGSFAWLHSVHSQKKGTTLPTAHYYVNDVYDTQRRRVPKEASRVRYDP
jgi:hypothetical protein